MYAHDDRVIITQQTVVGRFKTVCCIYNKGNRERNSQPKCNVYINTLNRVLGSEGQD